jgi:hypothetical protein
VIPHARALVLFLFQEAWPYKAFSKRTPP